MQFAIWLWFRTGTVNSKRQRMVGSKGCQVGSLLVLRAQPFPGNCYSMVSEWEKFNELA